MQLTLYTDYSLRVLVYLGLVPERTATITEIANAYQISRNHLVKVVHNLSLTGFIRTTRGRGGGIALARDPEHINIGDVVRHTEGNFHLVECFDVARNACPIALSCFLKDSLYDAQRAFMAVLDNKTLADMLKNSQWLRSKLQMPQARHV